MSQMSDAAAAAAADDDDDYERGWWSCDVYIWQPLSEFRPC